MAALQSELNFALEAADKVPAIGVVREQERVLAPSADIAPRAPENQSALLWQHNFLIINSSHYVHIGVLPQLPLPVYDHPPAAVLPP